MSGVAAPDGADRVDAAAAPEGLRIAIIGIGLMGGSLGRALRGAGHVVIGCDLDEARLRTAVELGAIDDGRPSITAAAKGADVAFVAVPVLQVADAVAAQHLAEEALDLRVELRGRVVLERDRATQGPDRHGGRQ